MIDSQHILSDAELEKVVGFVVIAIIWGIGAMASTIKKANEEAKRRAQQRAKGATPSAARQAAQTTSRPQAAAKAMQTTRRQSARLNPPPRVSQPARLSQTARVAQPPRRQMPAMRLVGYPPAIVQKAAQLARMSSPKPVVAPAPARQLVSGLVQGRVAAARQSPAIAAPAADQRATDAAPRSANAPALRRWLRPATLRQQFILSEIFQPTVALRETGNDI